LRCFPVEPNSLAGPRRWCPVEVTAHRDWKSLVEYLSPYRVERLLLDGPEFNVVPGVLCDDPGLQRSRLGASLGVELCEERAYVLIRLRRVDGRAEHEVTARPTRRFFDRMWHLDPAWRKASARVKPGRRIHDADMHDAVVSADEAQRYVDLFYDFGTHFTSAVDLGDILLQLVELEPGSTADVLDAWTRLGNGGPVLGDDALGFGRYLSPLHATRVGPILSLAGDPALPNTVGSGAWSDTGSPDRANLLALFLKDEATVASCLSTFEAVAPVGVELTSLARFMEYFRAINFERVLRGAMLQRWAGRCQLPLRRMPSIDRALEESLLQGGTLPTAAEGKVLLYGDALPVQDRRGLSEGDTRVLGCHRVMSFVGHRGPVHLRNAGLLAQIIEGPSGCHRAAVLRMPAGEFNDSTMACQTMVGAFILENETSGEPNAVVDGLRFENDSSGGGPGKARVRVRNDLHALDPEKAAELLPSITGALESASVALSAAGGDAPPREGVASFAEWIAGLLPEVSPAREIQESRALALYLARVGACISKGDAIAGNGASVRLLEVARQMSAFAAAADRLIRRRDELMPRGVHGARAAAAGSLCEETLTLRELAALRQDATRCYVGLLDEIQSAGADGLGAAREMRKDASRELLTAASAVTAQEIPARLEPPGKAVFDAMVSAPSDGPVPRYDRVLSQHVREKTGADALEFTGRESRARLRAAQLRAIRVACDELKAGADSAGTTALTLSKLVKLEDWARESEPLARRDLRRVLEPSDGTATDGSVLDHLLDAWERFEGARDRLAAVERAHLGCRMERWFHSVFRSAAPPLERLGLTGVLHRQQIERFRLLAVLAKTLGHQRAALRTAGCTGPSCDCRLEPGSMGGMLAYQNSALSKYLTDAVFAARAEGGI
jgi:hypothetical protein